jgi:hypothetical protein
MLSFEKLKSAAIRKHVMLLYSATCCMFSFNPGHFDLALKGALSSEASKLRVCCHEVAVALDAVRILAILVLLHQADVHSLRVLGLAVEVVQRLRATPVPKGADTYEKRCVLGLPAGALGRPWLLSICLVDQTVPAVAIPHFASVRLLHHLGAVSRKIEGF